MAPDSGHMSKGHRSLREEARVKHKEPKLSTKLASQKEDRHSQAGLALFPSFVYQEHLHQKIRSVLSENI